MRARREVGSSVSAGRQNRLVRAEPMQSAIFQTHCGENDAGRALCSSMIKSAAKYSTKNCVSCLNACPYSVCNIACPVLSAAHAHLYAWPPFPYSKLCPPTVCFGKSFLPPFSKTAIHIFPTLSPLPALLCTCIESRLDLPTSPRLSRYRTRAIANRLRTCSRVRR